MKIISVILINLVPLALTIGAVYLCFNQLANWGWFLVMGGFSHFFSILITKALNDNTIEELPEDVQD